MHCFRRAVSRLQLSSASSSPITSARLVARSRCSIPSTPIIAASRIVYPSAVQARWNSTDGSDKNTPITYPEDVTPEQERPGRRRQYVSEGPDPKPTVYVGNLFFDVTAEDMRKQFEQYGVVENTMIVHDARGLSKGFGYVAFSTTEEATNAINQQHGAIYEGREVVVNYANTTYKAARVEGTPTKTLYIGNLPYELTDVDLQEIFEDLHGVMDVRIPVDRRTGLPRGFGHVDFADQASASAGLELLARKAPYGRKLRVNFAKRKVLDPKIRSQHSRRTDQREVNSHITEDAEEGIVHEESAAHEESAVQEPGVREPEQKA